MLFFKYRTSYLQADCNHQVTSLLTEGLPIKLLEAQTLWYLKNHIKEYYLSYTNKKKSAAPNIVTTKKNSFSCTRYELISAI